MTMGFDCGMTNWIGLEKLAKSNLSDLPERLSMGVSSGLSAASARTEILIHSIELNMTQCDTTRLK